MRQRFGIQLDRTQATRMSCENAHCEANREGWVIVIDPSNPAQAKAARQIDHDGAFGRRYIHLKAEEAEGYVANHPEFQKWSAVIARTTPGMHVYIFPAGQQCFRVHLDREVIFRHDRKVTERFDTYRDDWNEQAYLVNELRRKEGI